MSNRNVAVFVFAAAALLASAACGTRAEGPPAIEVDRTACAHCGMLISEPAYAGAYRVEGGEAAVFDDIACLVNSARKAGVPDRARFWFHDVDNGEWIDGAAAVFVKSAALKTPMGGGIVAYRDSQTAVRAAAKQRGEVIASLQKLLATRGES